MMAHSLFRPLAERVRELHLRFERDARGIAAVEFAMLLPVMIVCYFGCLEVTQGFAASRKVAILARSLSDLTSQASTAITTAEMTNIFDASRGVLAPFESSGIKMTVTGVVFSGTASAPRAYTDWSATRNGTPRSCGELTQVPNGTPPAPNTIPSGIVSAGTTIIVSDVEYTYVPLVGGAFKTIGSGSTMSVPLKNTSYMRPRTVTRVTFSGTGVNCNPTFP